MSDLEYPAMLYKADGSMLEWDGEMFDYLIVEDADEAAAARKDGWSHAKPDKAKKVEVELKVEDKPEVVHKPRAKRRAKAK